MIQNHNFYSILSERFPDQDDAVFIETEAGRTISYHELETSSARIANMLCDHGLVKGDRVAVQVEKSPEVLFLYMACLRAGLIYLPLNTAYTESELEYFIGNAEPRAVICDPDSNERFTRLGVSLLSQMLIFELDINGTGSLMDQASIANSEYAAVDCEADDTAVILYTSGTTGKPKGAMLTHGNLSANARALHEAWGWQREDVLLHSLPIFHIHGLFVACHSVLFGGSRMIYMNAFDAARVAALLPRASVMMGVPTYYTRLLNYPDFSQAACTNMRLFISGSAPLHEKIFADFRACTGHTILERYGMTETGMNCSNPLEGERLAGTVGLPLPGVSLRIVDDEGLEVAGGDVGHLEVKGENVFKGYWRMPDKTAQAFTEDGYFMTGDMARLTQSGYIAIVGRDKDMIITGGLNVYPKEVEIVLDELDGVAESAVIGLPHEDFGEAVTAVVVPRNIKTPPEVDDLIRQMKASLAGFKVPKHIIFVDQLPRNTMGKVQKNLMRERYASKPD